MKISSQGAPLIQFDLGDSPLTSHHHNENPVSLVSAPVSAQHLFDTYSSKEQSNDEDNDDDINERTVDDLMSEISDIDREITSIRFNKQLDKNQIIEEINKLMERRNKFTDVLQSKRTTEFKEFVNSLNLPELHITPFFGGPRKCTLQISDEAANEILKSPPVEAQKKWGVGLFRRKSTTPDEGNQNSSHNYYSERQVAQLNSQYKEFNASIRAKLVPELEKLQKKKYFSPDDIAAYMRINAELEELERFSHEKK